MKKTLLITGASSGIGKAAARRFQAEGWNVIATMRSPERETELTEQSGVLVTRLDVLDVGSITTGVVAAVRRSPASRARQQDRRADHRLRGHRPPGVAAYVGQASARLPSDGISD